MRLSSFSVSRIPETILTLIALATLILPPIAASATGSPGSSALTALLYRGGLLWGPRDFVGSGNVGACLAANGVIVFDISDPTNPTPISRVRLDPLGHNGASNSIILKGDQLYVSHGNAWSILNIADPHNPSIVSTQFASGTVFGFTVTESHLYAGVGFDQLLTYDLTSPELPSRVDSQSVPGSVGNLSSTSTYLYCAGTELFIYDLADPTAPVFTGQTSGLNFPTVVNTLSGYVYLGEILENHLTIIDATNAFSPIIADSFPTNGQVREVEISGNDAIVLQTNLSLHLDLTNPAVPTVRGSLGGGGGGAIVDSLAYVCGGPGLSVYNLAQFTVHPLVGIYPVPRNQENVAYANDHVYILANSTSHAGQTDTILIADASNLSNPVLVGSIAGDFRDIVATGSLLVATDSFLDSVRVFDVSVPALPNLISVFHASAFPLELLSRDTLILVSSASSTQIWNLADPANPQPLSTLDIIGNVPALADTILFVARAGQIVTYNIADLANPIELSSVDSVGPTVSMIAIDTLLLQISRIGSTYVLNVYDIANPQSLSLLGTLTVGRRFADMLVADGIPILATGLSSAHIVDLSDPLMPQLAGSFGTDAEFLAVSGSLVAMSGLSGLIIAEVQSSDTALLGDVNSDFAVTSADIIYTINYLFKDGPEPLPTFANADVNCSSAVTSADVIYLVNYVFKGGPTPDCSP